MVDFQSRDTSRGLGEEDDEEPEADDETEAEEEPETEEEPESAASTDVEADGAVTENEADSETEEATAPTGAVDTPGEAPESGAGSGGAEASPEGTPAPDETETAYAIVTVTAERSLSDDDQGDTVVDAVEDAGGGVVTRDLVQPDYDGIQSTLSTLAERKDVDVVVTIGGTGVEPDDITVDALEPLFEKRLPGFGELLRLLAHETDGTAVVGTRATAGIVEGTPIFAVPGTVDGAERAVEEIVLQEGSHLAADATGNTP